MTESSTPRAADLTPKRINEAHTEMTKAACETSAEHDVQGFRHRAYSQSHTEGCYICWLLEENARQKRALSEGSFADGFRAARKLASAIVGAYTDGDCPFDSTIAVMVDKIDRLMPPGAPK